ncbi:MAG: hypothetical protein EBR23_10720 [Planctomycetia bacterium]|nr:hypothetical protein [Planctomycetia bacterium]
MGVASKVAPNLKTATYTWITLAGNGLPGSANGTGGAAQFNNPSSIALDGVGNLYVSDTYNHAIRKVTQSGVVTTVAGSLGAEGQGSVNGGALTTARLDSPQGIAVDKAGSVYFAEPNSNTVRKLTNPGPTTGSVSTVAGELGQFGVPGGLNSPCKVALGPDNSLYVLDYSTIRKVVSPTQFTLLFGELPESYTGTQPGPMAMAVDGVPERFRHDSMPLLSRTGRSRSRPACRPSSKYRAPPHSAVAMLDPPWRSDHLDPELRACSGARMNKAADGSTTTWTDSENVTGPGHRHQGRKHTDPGGRTVSPRAATGHRRATTRTEGMMPFHVAPFRQRGNRVALHPWRCCPDGQVSVTATATANSPHGNRTTAARGDWTPGFRTRCTGALSGPCWAASDRPRAARPGCRTDARAVPRPRANWRSRIPVPRQRPPPCRRAARACGPPVPGRRASSAAHRPQAADPGWPGPRGRVSPVAPPAASAGR